MGPMIQEMVTLLSARIAHTASQVVSVELALIMAECCGLCIAINIQIE